MSIFTNDPAVAHIAANSLRIFSCGNVAYAFGMVMMQAFNGAGDTITPTIVNLVGFWILELPLAWWLAHQDAVGGERCLLVGGVRGDVHGDCDDAALQTGAMEAAEDLRTGRPGESAGGAVCWVRSVVALV